MPREDTQFKKGQPRPAGAGMKKGQKIFRTRFLEQLKQAVSSTEKESKLDRMIKNAITLAINGEHPFFQSIMESVDGRDYKVTIDDVENSLEKEEANKINKLNAKEKKIYFAIVDRAIGEFKKEKPGTSAVRKVAGKKSGVRKKAVPGIRGIHKE